MGGTGMISTNFIDSVYLKQFIEAYKDRRLPMTGVNESGENVIVSVSSDNVSVRTLQNNGWARLNVYWLDGTVEESYER